MEPARVARALKITPREPVLLEMPECPGPGSGRGAFRAPLASAGGRRIGPVKRGGEGTQDAAGWRSALSTFCALLDGFQQLRVQLGNLRQDLRIRGQRLELLTQLQ